MFCPKCGKINPDTQERCSGCDALLHEEKQETSAPKKGRVVRVILAIVIIVVAAVVAVSSLSGCEKRTTAPDAGMEISF